MQLQDLLKPTKLKAVALLVIIAAISIALYLMRNMEGKIVSPSLVMITTQDHFSMIVDKDDKHFGRHLIQHKTMQPHLKKYYDYFITKGSTIIDIGSSYGYHSLYFAMKGGNFSTIYAIEPRADIARISEYNFNMNKVTNVVMLNKLLYSSTGVYYMQAPAHSSYWQLLPEHSYEKQANKQDIYQVQTHRLDDVISNVFGVNLMRISTGGTELEVLKSARNIIEKSPNIGIFITWNKSAIALYSDYHKIVNQLEGIGFSFWYVDVNGLLKLMSKNDLLALNAGDVILTRKDIAKK